MSVRRRPLRRPGRPAGFRKAAERKGRIAERIAAWRLRASGWRVLATRHRSPFGEIDLVVRRGEVLAFVEVKARRTRAEAAEAVTESARVRLRRAAAAFLGAHPELRGLALRFDAVLVTPWTWPQHLPGAWDDGARHGDV